MSDLSSLLFVRTAPAAAATQWETDATATYVFQEPVATPTYAFDQRKLERNLIRGDNEKYSRVVGPQEPWNCNLQTHLKGLNANSGDAVTTAKLTDLDPLLAACFGSAGVGGTGSTAASATTGTLTVADASSITAGRFIAFQDDAATGDELIARQVDGKSSNDLTLDRDWSGDIVTSGTVYCGISYALAMSTHRHTPIHVDFEGENWRRKGYGGLPDLKIGFPNNGDLITLDWSIVGTKWEDVAEANPSYTAPTCGSPIPNIDATFWIGNTEYLVRDVACSITQKRAPVVTNSGANGFFGYDVQSKDVSWEFTIVGGASAPEGPDSLLNTLQTGATLGIETTQDIAMQVGRTAGAAMYMRMPAACISASRVSVDGMDSLKCTAMPSRSAEASSTASFYLAVF